MRKKNKSKKDQQLHFLENMAENNARAMYEGGRKKSWSLHDLTEVKPLNEAQALMMRSFIEGGHVVASGYAGTGKTLIALYLALNDILGKESNRTEIKIVRSIVPARDSGFLPGTMEEKMEPYESVYRDLIEFLLGKNKSYENLKDANYLTFVPTNFVRGATWDDCVIIIDEVQNMTWEEISSVMTRTGTNSKVIAIGDYLQNDLYRNKYDSSGIERFLKVAAKMDMFDIVNFHKEDIVRSEFVKSFLIASEETL
jgi:phosphate starvation-inducible PhoH-like protein